MLKLWHDDIRFPPDDSWTWVRTNQAAREILEKGEVVEISLDHDLGLENHDPHVQDADILIGWDKENDGYDLVKWMIAHNILPEKITIHSWNPDGAARMASALRDAGCNPIVRRFEREGESPYGITGL